MGWGEALLIALLLQQLEKEGGSDKRRVLMIAVISNTYQSDLLNFISLQSIPL